MKQEELLEIIKLCFKYEVKVRNKNGVKVKDLQGNKVKNSKEWGHMNWYIESKEEVQITIYGDGEPISHKVKFEEVEFDKKEGERKINKSIETSKKDLNFWRKIKE